MMIAIAKMTFKEALRKKILLAAIILTFFFLALYTMGLYFAADDLSKMQHGKFFGSYLSRSSDAQRELWAEQPKRLLLLLGIYFSSSIVSLLAIFSSVGSVSTEIENGMLHAVLAKPIRRRSVILGKFAGYALMISLYAAALFISIVFLNRYISGIEAEDISSAMILFLIQPLILLSVTVAGSTKFSTLANGIVAFMLYLIGIVGGVIEQVGAVLDNPALLFTGIITSLIMPVDAIYRMMVDLVAGPINQMLIMPFGTLSKPSAAMPIYAVIYLLSFVGAAVYIFSKRDIG